MRIVINGRDDVVSADPGSRFGTILGQLRQWLDKNSMLITLLNLDGAPLDPARENEAADRPVDDFKELTVEAAAARDLALDTLQNVKQYTDRVKKAQLSTAQHYRSGESDFSDDFNFVLTWWESLQRTMVDVIRLLRVDPESICVEDVSLSDHLANLTTPLAEMDGAFKARDFALVGDLLEYEFTPRLDTWCSLLSQVMAKIEAMPGPGETDAPEA
ncbi:MAG: hypothetical protein E3J72_03930 [Planctomycetota bacterium]|nr:MAG: hypothetical protein E3J72_03930 [Planctomycetota bacterium]